jgi:hypothetical protein
VARLRAPFYPVIAEQLEQSRQLFALQVELQFGPELGALDTAARTETLAAADAICSFETYDFLRARGLNSAAIAGVMRRTLTGLFAGSATRYAGEPGGGPE